MGLVKKILKGAGKKVIRGTGKVIGGTGKAIGNAITDDLVEGAAKASRKLEDATFYERIIGKKLNAKGVALATVGTMGVSTAGAIITNGSKTNKLGYISVGDNLDRLVSYDGSGFINNINTISGGDTEVMQDIVRHSFDKPNQISTSGDIVFALHNMREG